MNFRILLCICLLTVSCAFRRSSSSQLLPDDYDIHNIAYIEGVALPDNFENTLCERLDGEFPVLSLQTKTTTLSTAQHPFIREVISYYLADGVNSIKYPFNPGLVALADGYLLAFRFDCTERTKKAFGTDIQSYTLLAELDSHLQPRGPLQYLHRPTVVANPTGESHNAEDMRLFTWQGKIYGLVNDNLNGLDTKWTTRHQFLYLLEKDKEVWKITHTWELKHPRYHRFEPEKNWTPLVGNPHDHSLVFNHSLWGSPTYVTSAEFGTQAVHLEMNLSYRCGTHTPWDGDSYGKLRGGTPALWLSDQHKYFAFFHSVSEHNGKQYAIGAYEISPENNCIIDISPAPISYPGMFDEPKGFWVKLAGAESNAIFPMGLVDGHFQGASVFLLSVGVQDSTLKIFVLDRAATLASMVNTDKAMGQRLQQAPVEILVDEEKHQFDTFVSTHKIVVSMTTSPTRIHQIQPLLDALAQDPLLSTIYLALPETYGRNKESYSIPPWLNKERYPNLEILRPHHDLGPISKMLFAVRELRKHYSKNGVVISVDDDTGYAKDTFKQIVKKMASQPRAVVGASSQGLHYWHIPPEQATHWHQGVDATVIEGFGAIGYPIDLVDDRLMEDIVSNNRYCFASDDIVLSWVLDHHDVARIKISNEYVGIDKNFQFTWGFGRDALHKGGGLEEKSVGDLNLEKYQKCNSYLAERENLRQDEESKKSHLGEQEVNRNNLAAYVLESPAEIEFKQQLAQIVASRALNLCYFLGSPSYFLEHLLPLHHVYPAQFCGLSSSERVKSNLQLLKKSGFSQIEKTIFENSSTLQSYFDDPHSFMVGCSGLEEQVTTHDRYTSLGHGIDADGIYYDNLTLSGSARPVNDIPLIFSKYLESKYARPEEVLDYYRADSRRKTVLFLPTEGIFELADRRAPAEVRENILSELVKLKRNYNVIVRPHPLIGPEIMRFYRDNFVISSPGIFPSFVPLYDAADVIIATPAGGGSVATSRARIPLVLLRPRHLWDGRGDADEISARNFNFTLNESNTILQKDINIDLATRVEEALFDSGADEKIAGREKYFKLWFGCIDGYEEYRVFIERILPAAGISSEDIAKLKAVYGKFPLYKDRALCTL